MSKRTDSSGLGSLVSGALTAASTLVVTGASAIAGVIIAREFGRTEETDGFFAAYGVFIVIVLAAQAIRIAVLPSLARARVEQRLAGELAAYAVALGAVALPIALVAALAPGPIATVLTGNGSSVAQQAAADTLKWVVLAAVIHLFAGLAASGLAALDDYVIAAAGYAAGSVLGIAFILERVGDNGIDAVAWGMTLNGVVALAVPLIGLALRARGTRMPATALRLSGPPIQARLRSFGTATALPLALQVAYVVCLPFAAREGVGAQTSFAYAYIGAAALVAVSASSLGLVTSVPLTRAGLDAPRIVLHVISSAWLAFIVIGGIAGAVALAGDALVEAVLGSAYAGAAGTEVTRLIVTLTPWMAMSVGVSLAFALVFVTGRTGALVWIGAASLVLQVPLAWAGQAVAGLYGIAVSLAVSALVVLVGLLWQLGVVRGIVRGLAAAAGTTACVAGAAFVPAALVLDAAAAAAVGLLVYAVLVAVLRPAGLRASWAYLRSLR